MFFNNISFAIRSLSSNKMRSALTMLGVMIGVFAVTVLMSISQGVRQEVSAEVEDMGSNVVLILPGKIDSDGGGGMAMMGASTLNNSDMQSLKESIPAIDAIDGLSYPGGVVSNGQVVSATALVTGAGLSIDAMLGRSQAAGRWINQADMDSAANVVVLDWLEAQALFPDEAPESLIGKSIRISTREFTIVGVDAQTHDASSLFSSFNPIYNRVTMPLTTAQQIANNQRLSRIVVRIESTSEVSSAVEQIKSQLLSLHNGVEDFSVMTQDEILSTFNSIFGIITNAVTGIAAISLIVGGIGIMNIMLVAVAERTREIGIRKALGATDGQILQQFLFEAVTLGFLGGLVGLGLSVVATFVIRHYLDIRGIITAESVLLALGISIGAGIIFGVIPALNAARKKPVEALRYE